MTENLNPHADLDQAKAVVDRVLERQKQGVKKLVHTADSSALIEGLAETHSENLEGGQVVPKRGGVFANRAASLQSTQGQVENSAGAMEREARQATRRVASMSTELEDVSEVEYRQIRLEKVVLVGIYATDVEDAENSLHELAALAETAGSEVLDGMLQRRDMPDPATYLGKGKAKELAEIVADCGADTVIVDGELAPSQRRGLEDAVKVKVVDRTALILDYFCPTRTVS